MRHDCTRHVARADERYSGQFLSYSRPVELKNHLTMNAVHDHNLAWDFEEREDNQRVFLKAFSIYFIFELSILYSITGL